MAVLSRSPPGFLRRHDRATAVTSREPALDGLRAIAVIAVVAYHLGVPLAGGGFAGVDVFFVLSGFLITSILLREYATTGGISIANFYARRARRLVPALTVVLLATLAATWTVIAEQPALNLTGGGTVATAVFGQNLYLIRHTGRYFEPTTENPLLHLWSLSVEEQFYLLWPIALIVLLRRRRSRPALGVTLGVVILVSFASLWLPDPQHLYRFYSPWTRAWGIAVGALLAWRFANGPVRVGGITTIVGLVAIAAAFVALDTTIVDSPWRLSLPALGAAAVVAGVAQAPGGGAARFLAFRPFVWIGERSYGWYLWHFPAITLAEYANPDSASAATLAAAASLGLAHVSFEFIEWPVRQQRFRLFASNKRTLTAAAIALGTLCAAGLWVRSETIPKGRVAFINWITRRCATSATGSVGNTPLCTMGKDSARTRVLLYGDSHARALAPLFDSLGKELDFELTLRWQGECPPLVRYWAPGRGGGSPCRTFNDSVFESVLEGRDRYDAVVLAARWTRVFGEIPREPRSRRWFFQTREGWHTESIRALATLAASRTFDAITGTGPAVLVIPSLPEWRHSPEDCVRLPAGECIEPYADVAAFRQSSTEALRRAAVGRRVWQLDLFNAVCNTTICSLGDMSKYFDSNHLTSDGALAMMPDTRCAIAELLRRQTLAGSSCPYVVR